MAQWYARAAIYALPARYEPFGLTALEAALSGCALVLADLPSLRETWGDAACFADMSDPQALRAALAALIEDEPRRAELAARARARATRFTPQRLAREYLALYRTLRAPHETPRVASAARRAAPSIAMLAREIDT